MNVFALGSADWRGQYTEIRPDEHVVDPSQPIIVWLSDHLEAPELYRGATLVDYSMERITSDTLCGWDVVALTPDVRPVPGDEFTIVSPEIRQRAFDWEETHGEPADEPGELEFSFGEPRADVDTNVRVSVIWERDWPFQFNGGICDANALLPYKGQGWARVTITSADDVEFYATARVHLPEGESYQELNLSGWNVAYVDGEYRKLQGSKLGVSVPLTSTADVPECVDVTVYDQNLEVVFEQELCPPEESYGEPSATSTFDVALAPLPEYPIDDKEEKEGGCALVPGAGTGGGAPALFLLLLLGLRRFRLALARVLSQSSKTVPNRCLGCSGNR